MKREAIATSNARPMFIPDCGLGKLKFQLEYASTKPSTFAASYHLARGSAGAAGAAAGQQRELQARRQQRAGAAAAGGAGLPVPLQGESRRR